MHHLDQAMWGPLVREVLTLVSEGLNSNFWGLGCPVHCQGTSIAAVLCAYLLGLLSAAGLAILFFLYPPRPSVQHLSSTRDQEVVRQRAGQERLSLYGHTRL